jgi:hypothetical protein
MFLTAAPMTTPNPLNAKSCASLPNSAIAFCPVLSLHPKIWRVGIRICSAAISWGSNECPPATVSSYTVVVSHLAFGTLSLRSINASRRRRSWNVRISCSQDGPQGSQHLIRFSVGHFALAQGSPWGDIVRDSGSGKHSHRSVRPESPSPVRAPRSSIFRLHAKYCRLSTR